MSTVHVQLAHAHLMRRECRAELSAAFFVVVLAMARSFRSNIAAVRRAVTSSPCNAPPAAVGVAPQAADAPR